MGRLDRHELKDCLVEYLGEDGTLDALTRAMGDDEFRANFEYIIRCHDIPEPKGYNYE